MSGLRTSSYTIYVDLPDTPADVLLVHGYSGACDRVSRRVAGYLRSLEKARPARPLYGEWVSEVELPETSAAPAPETLAVLKRRGYLTEMSREEEVAAFGAFASKLHERMAAAPPSYLFMPTYDCNLRCPYCFQDSMRTDPARRRLLRLMTPQMADRIFLGIDGIEAALPPAPPGGRKRRRIGFFGGEPLLGQTRPIVEHIIGRALARGEAEFWAVSNATELEHFDDLLGPHAIADLQITLDGPPEEHDRRRIRPDGSGSFAAIARNISLALERGVKVAVRINVDRRNAALLPALADEIAARGWPEHPNFSVYTAPIWVANDHTDPATTFGSWELDRAIERLRGEHPSMRIVGAPDDRLKSQVRRIFDEGYDPLPSFRASYCGAHTNMYIFDAFGDIYACWEHTGDQRVRIGKVEEDGTVSVRTPLNEQWRSRTVTSNPVCGQCRYALYCGGGCAIRALQETGEFFKNYCDSFQRRFRVTVREAYDDHVSGRSVLQQVRVCDL